MAKIWLSMTVEGDVLSGDGGEPLIDWRIVVAPPLVIQNQLPVAGSVIVWEQAMVRPLLQMEAGSEQRVPQTHVLSVCGLFEPRHRSCPELFFPLQAVKVCD